jgi:hypothetical protein
MIRLPSLLAVLAVTAPLLAQVPAVDPAPKRDRVEERSQEMRKQIDTGRHLMSHVRVAVRLKNGNRLQGVVKDGRLVERVDGLRFVDAQAQETGAGIRLWYSTGRRNYVFVPFADLADYEVEERLSQKQLDALEDELQMDESKREDQIRRTQQPTQDAPAIGDAVPPEGDAAPAPGQEVAPSAKVGKKSGKQSEQDAGDKEKLDAAAALKAQQKDWVALLQDYPPAAGWNQAKRDEISRRKIVVGAVPSEKEQKFVDQFAEWQKACLFFDVKVKESAEPTEESGSSKTRRSSRGKKESTAEEETSGETDTGRRTRRQRN